MMNINHFFKKNNHKSTKMRHICAMAAALLLAGSPAIWAENPQLARPTLTAPSAVPPAPSFNAKAWILVDYGSRTVIAAHNAAERFEPASITKVMTSYVVYEALRDGLIKMEDKVEVSKRAWQMEGSRMFIEAGKQVSVHDLLKGLVIQSGNDAAVALAEYVGGTEAGFVKMMNATAARLGMSNTHFMNSTGLPHKEHYSSAQDIAILSRALIADFPDHYPDYAIKEFTYNKIRQDNRNRLLWSDNSVDGIKTGHTSSAGYCLSASAQRGQMRLISVILGTKSEGDRARYSQNLLNYGFRYFESHLLYAKGAALSDIKVFKGDQKTVPVGAAEDIYVLINKGAYQNLQPSLENIPVPLVAPIQNGQPLGQIKVTLGNQLLVDVPAVALQAVGKGSFFSRIADSIWLWFE